LHRVCAVLDAQRQQLFVADFRREGECLVATTETRIEDNAAWLAGLSPGTAVTGPGLATLRDKLPPGIIVVDAACWTPRAATVGLAASLERQSGSRHDLWTLNPVYYRSSAAEEKKTAAKGNLT
jgi:tRNA A37 threonylcarbamoyladenosine modification protein TsaB